MADVDILSYITTRMVYTEKGERPCPCIVMDYLRETPEAAMDKGYMFGIERPLPDIVTAVDYRKRAQFMYKTLKKCPISQDDIQKYASTLFATRFGEIFDVVWKIKDEVPSDPDPRSQMNAIVDSFAYFAVGFAMQRMDWEKLNKKHPE